MQRPPSSFPLRNYILFVALSFAILAGYSYFVAKFLPHPPPGQVAEKGDKGEKGGKVEKAAEGKKPVVAPAEKGPAKAEAGPKQKPNPPAAKEKPPAKPARPAAKIPVAWVALGSADEASPYRMLVTFCNRGAGPGTDRAQQPPLSRPRRPQRLSRPRGHGRGPPGRRRTGPGRRRGNPGGKGRLDEGRPDHRRRRPAGQDGADLQKALRRTKPARLGRIDRRSRGQAVDDAFRRARLAALGGRPPGAAESGRFDGGRARARRLESGKGLPPVDARHARATRRPAPQGRRETGRRVGERVARRAASQGELGSGPVRAGSRRLPADVAHLRAASHEDLPIGEDAPGKARGQRLSLLSPGVRHRGEEHRRPTAQGRLPAGRSERFAARRVVVCLQGEPHVEQRGPARFDREVRRGRDANGRLPENCRRQGPLRVARAIDLHRRGRPILLRDINSAGRVGRRHFRVDAAAGRRRRSRPDERHERLLAAGGQAARAQARRSDQRQLPALCRSEEAAAAGRVQARRRALLRLVRLGRRADALDARSVLFGAAQLRAGHRAVDRGGSPLHVSLQPQAGAGRRRCR